MTKEREIDNFVRLGADLKKACKVLGFSRGALPSHPVFYQLVKICKLPVERFFFDGQ